MIHSMNSKELRNAFSNELGTIRDAKHLESLRVKYLGREAGKLTAILRSLKDLTVEERRKIGPEANALRDEIEKALQAKLADFERHATPEIDLTRPGVKIRHGHLHPLTLVQDEVNHIFRSLNFSIVEGPEIETEYYNFDALNIPPNHPAREMWDTFWLKRDANIRMRTNDTNKNANAEKGKLLLRTHTSPMQIRYMEKHNPPFQILVPGRVFRYEATDATHETNFGQFEGLMVGKDISIANFKYVIETFFDKFFNRKIEFRYRPSFFPFVEPGWEVDVRLAYNQKLKTNNSNKSSVMSHKSDWLEMMGAGMVHPNLFENVGYNPREWSGFAFGMSLERLAMIKYKIPDIRLFYSGDLRFIEQF